LHKYGSLALTKCNFATNTLDLDETIPTFYKKMLGYWCDFRFPTDIDPKTNPTNEIVWNNRKILVGKKSVFLRKMVCRHYLDKRHIKPKQWFFEMAWVKFNLNIPFTTYYGLVIASPKNWKAYLKYPIQNVKYHTTVSTLRTSSIYSSLKNHYCSAHSQNYNSTPRIYRQYHPESLSYAILSHKWSKNNNDFCFSLKWFIMCFQPTPHFIETASQKTPYAIHATPKNKRCITC